MEFRKMQYIIKIAECGNITHAAEELYLSQPALSHCLARVERELGTPLFDRSGNPLKLTEAGECYVRTARRILELEQKMRRDIQNIAHLPFIILKKGHRARSVFDEYCQTHDYHPRVIMETSSFDAVVRFVKSEIGVAVIPTFYVENVAQQAGVESFLFPMDSSKWDVGLVYSEGRMLTAAERELLRIFRQTFKDRPGS